MPGLIRPVGRLARLAHVVLVALALVVLVPVAVPAGPASADGADHDRLGLSWDGRHWAAALTGTLFDPAGARRHWVPGDSDTRRFWVRNRSGDAATLRIEHRLPPGVLAAPGNVRLEVRIGGGAWRPLRSATGWVRVGTRPLAPGASSPVDVRGVFDWSSTNHSQDRVLPVDLRVRLAGIAADTAAGTAADTGAGDAAGPGGATGARTGALADAGAPELRWLTGLGALCLGGGLLIALVARRKEQQRC